MVEKNKRYEIRVVKKVHKNLSKLPKNIRERFVTLAEELRDRGPIAHDWPNYRKLGNNRAITVT
jgi:mRNA-degrading endonuclease RelE of RelBE toxin-antitoxin system